MLTFLYIRGENMNYKVEDMEGRRVEDMEVRGVSDRE